VRENARTWVFGTVKGETNGGGPSGGNRSHENGVCPVSCAYNKTEEGTLRFPRTEKG